VRVAAIYDIHGNLPALEAVLEDIRRANVDQIIVGGDVVPGPMPHETLACLLSLDPPASFIRGNGDRVVVAQMDGMEATEVPEQFRDVIRWSAEHLDPGDKRALESWPATLRMEIPDVGDVLFCHATPRSDTEIFTRLTTEDRLLAIFASPRVPLVVCGHTHMQFDRTVGQTRVVNAGSVGMPYGEPGAYWLLLGPNVELRRTTYDFEKAADRVRATTYPQAPHFAMHGILQPPPEQAILDAFARAT
jgi:putative phosphoesterase